MDIIALAFKQAAVENAPSAKEQLDASGIPKFEAFKPPTGRDLTEKESFNLLCATGNVVPVVSLPIPYAPNKTYKWSQGVIQHTADARMYNRLKTAELPLYCAAAMQQTRNNGCRRGVTTRMCKQLVGPLKLLEGPTTQQISKRLFVFDTARPGETGAYPSQLLPDDPAFMNLNYDSDAGFPYQFETATGLSGGAQPQNPKIRGTTRLAQVYFDKTDRNRSVPLGPAVPILTHALGWSRTILRYLEAPQTDNLGIERLISFFATTPEFNTWLLKRKDEKIDRNQYLTKARPYGVQPLPMRLLGMFGVQHVEDNLVPFYHNPRSCSATLVRSLVADNVSSTGSHSM